jgi:sugar phosphate isomerase/epimerase
MVEIRGANAAHLGNDDPQAAREAAVASLRKHGIKVGCLMGYTHFSTVDDQAREKTVNECIKAIGLAKQIGAPVLRVFGGQPEDMDMKAAIPRAAKAIRKVVDAAQAANIQLALESHDAWCSSDNMLGLINAVDHPSLKVCWDPANVMPGESIDVSFEKLSSRIVHVHLKDITVDESRKVTPVLPGTGQVPLARIAGMLIGTGYKGCISLEWERWWHRSLPDGELALSAFAKLYREWTA